MQQRGCCSVECVCAHVGKSTTAAAGGGGGGCRGCVAPPQEGAAAAANETPLEDTTPDSTQQVVAASVLDVAACASFYSRRWVQCQHVWAMSYSVCTYVNTCLSRCVCCITGHPSCQSCVSVCDHCFVCGDVTWGGPQQASYLTALWASNQLQSAAITGSYVLCAGFMFARMCVATHVSVHLLTGTFVLLAYRLE